MLQDCGTQQGRSILVLIIEEIGAKTPKRNLQSRSLERLPEKSAEGSRFRVRGFGV